MFHTVTIGIDYTGMEGLTIGYAQGDVEVTTGTKGDESTLFAKYAMGGLLLVYKNQKKIMKLELMIQSQLELVFLTKLMMT